MKIVCVFEEKKKEYRGFNSIQKEKEIQKKEEFEPRTLRFEKPRGSVIMDCLRHVPRMEIRFGTSLRVPAR